MQTRLKKIVMFDFSIKKNTNIKTPSQKYFKCERCGYITIVRDSNCPICSKDGFKIKMK